MRHVCFIILCFRYSCTHMHWFVCSQSDLLATSSWIIGCIKEKAHTHRPSQNHTHIDKHKQWLQTVKATFCADDHPWITRSWKGGSERLWLSPIFSFISIALCFGVGHIVPPVGLPMLGPCSRHNNASWGLTRKSSQLASRWQVHIDQWVTTSQQRSNIQCETQWRET